MPALATGRERSEVYVHMPCRNEKRLDRLGKSTGCKRDALHKVFQNRDLWQSPLCRSSIVFPSCPSRGAHPGVKDSLLGLHRAYRSLYTSRGSGLQGPAPRTLSSAHRRRIVTGGLSEAIPPGRTPAAAARVGGRGSAEGPRRVLGPGLLAARRGYRVPMGWSSGSANRGSCGDFSGRAPPRQSAGMRGTAAAILGR